MSKLKTDAVRYSKQLGIAMEALDHIKRFRMIADKPRASKDAINAIADKALEDIKKLDNQKPNDNG